MSPSILIVMGVSGCGKTTVGRALGEALGWDFFDGDDFHPPANKAKMSQGLPLNDEDRAGWLAALADLIRQRLAAGQPAVLACSALKETYRDVLRVDPRAVQFVYLKGDYDLIWERMQRRQGHYMKASMLASQFATLEEPHDAWEVDIRLPPEEMVRIVRQEMRALA